MATIDATAILTRVREVLFDGAGSVRTITAGDFEPGIYENQEDLAKALAGGSSAPRADVRITSVARHASTPNEPGSIVLYDLNLEVLVVRGATLTATLSASVRHQHYAAASALDADKIRQALGWPGNLTQTAAAAATGLSSGMLLYTGSTVGPLQGSVDAGWMVQSTHSFRGVVQVTQAIV